MLAVLLNVAAVAEEYPTWPEPAWRANGEEMLVGVHTMSPVSKSQGQRTMSWHPTTNNKQGASWTNVAANVNGKTFTGIMYSKEPMEGTATPRPDQEVAVYLASTKPADGHAGMQALERAAEKLIALAPVTRSLPVPESTQAVPADDGDGSGRAGMTSAHQRALAAIPTYSSTYEREVEGDGSGPLPQPSEPARAQPPRLPQLGALARAPPGP